MRPHLRPFLETEPRGGTLRNIWRTHGYGSTRRRNEMNDLLESSNVRYRGDPAILYNQRDDVEGALDDYNDLVDDREAAASHRRKRRHREAEEREREEELMDEEEEYQRELEHRRQTSSAYQSGRAHGEYGLQGVYSSGYGRGRYDGYDDGYGAGYDDRSDAGYDGYDDGYDDGWDDRSDDGYGREADAYWGGWKNRAQYQGRRSERRPRRGQAGSAGGRQGGSSSRKRITWNYEGRGVPDGWTGGFAETIYDDE
ncbi:hypothetical protein MMC27_005389 [Xylographa pallens]|nr:hypothetical protein [Xylographa pallens]